MSIESTELILYIDNASPNVGPSYARALHPQKKAILTNLYKKKRKGIYKPELGRKGFMHLVNAGAKAYHREHGSPGSKWHHIFTPDSRQEAAKEYEQRFRDEYNAYALEWLVPEAKRRKRPGNPHGGSLSTTTRQSAVRMCPIGTEVQTLIFDKAIFTKATARAWAKRNGFRLTKVDETAGSFRIRQKDPARFRRSSLRTIVMGSAQAVIGCPDKTPKKRTASKAKKKATKKKAKKRGATAGRFEHGDLLATRQKLLVVRGPQYNEALTPHLAKQRGVTGYAVPKGTEGVVIRPVDATFVYMRIISIPNTALQYFNVRRTHVKRLRKKNPSAKTTKKKATKKKRSKKLSQRAATVAARSTGGWTVQSKGNCWYIVHPTKRAKRIGPARMRGRNYYDEAVAEAERRNKGTTTTKKRGGSPGNPHYKSMAAIKRANKAYAQRAGRAYWFAADAMRFFNTRIHGKPINHANTDGSFFVTSERMDERYPWKYTVRHATAEGFIDTVGEFQQYATLGSAIAAAKLTARTGRSALAG